MNRIQVINLFISAILFSSLNYSTHWRLINPTVKETVQEINTSDWTLFPLVFSTKNSWGSKDDFHKRKELLVIDWFLSYRMQILNWKLFLHSSECKKMVHILNLFLVLFIRLNITPKSNNLGFHLRKSKNSQICYIPPKCTKLLYKLKFSIFPSKFNVK